MSEASLVFEIVSASVDIPVNPQEFRVYPTFAADTGPDVRMIHTPCGVSMPIARYSDLLTLFQAAQQHLRETHP